MLFSFRRWWQRLLDGLRLFETRRTPSEPPPREASRPPYRPMSNRHEVTRYRAPNVVIPAGYKFIRAPRGGQALVVQANRENRPNTPGSGGRNGSR